jgi:hypothetical protein
MLCVAASVSCVGLVLPAHAHADDGAAAAEPSAAVAAATDALDALVADDTGDVVEAAAAALDALAPSVPAAAGALPAEPAQEEGPAAAVTADTPSTAVSASPATEASASDTTTEPGDTTGDSRAAVSPPSTTAPAPVAAPPAQTLAAGPPTTALNLNVDIRLDSGGDSGAVTQLNTATAAPSPPTGGVPTTGSQSGPASPSTPASSASEPGWYWEWDCLSTPAIPVVSPNGSGATLTPSSWTWIWNCPGNSEQYQGADSGQYQQINANISVRISSPGNNGPVMQTNIAISTGGGRSAPEPPRPSAGPTAPSGTQVTIGVTLPVIAIQLPAGEATVPAPVPVLSTVDGVIANVVEDVTLALRDATVVLGPSDAAAPVLPRRVPLRRAPIASTSGVPTPTGGGIVVIPAPSWSVDGRSSHAALESPGRAAGPQRATRRGKSAPSDRSPAPRAPATAPTGATVSAAGAGGSSGGGIPIFLALPFVAAMLDLARRVALDRATWPSGHGRRVPDRPG